MGIKKYHVQVIWEVTDGVGYEPIYAESDKQAGEIAIEQLKDKRSDYSKMENVRTRVTLCPDLTVAVTEKSE